MSQGKAWNKEKVIEVLKPYFQLGCSINRACEYAGIPQPTVQTWIGADEELQLKITTWQNELSAQSRKNIAKRIDAQKEDTSWKWLERKEKEEFGEEKKIDLGVDFQELYNAILNKRPETTGKTELSSPPATGSGGNESGEVQGTGSGEEIR